MTRGNNNLQFPISGMHCASCAANIQRSLKKIDGVSEVRVNYGNEIATIFSCEEIDKETVKKAEEKPIVVGHFGSCS